MKVKDVPQDNGMIENYGLEICYATNENGEYELAHSLGWDAKNIVNDQAWELIYNELKTLHDKIRANKLSPLAYHMARNQMDTKLLGKYVSLAGWRVKRHLKPKIFNKLSDSVLSKYADIFDISIEELKTVPENLNFEMVKYK